MPDTAAKQELRYGSKDLYHGTKELLYGSPTTFIPLREPLTPERIIVRAGRAVAVQFNDPNIEDVDGLPAYAVFQPGGTPTLPSVVFEVSGTDPLESLSGTRQVRQIFQIMVRAKTYKEVCILTVAMQNELRKDPSGRVREIGSGLDDLYAQNFEYRIRSFQVTIQM